MFLLQPVVDTTINKNDNGGLADVHIAKEPIFPSPAMFVRTVHNPSKKIGIKQGKSTLANTCRISATIKK